MPGVLALGGVALFLACGGNTTQPQEDEDPVPTSLTITPEAVAFTFVGERRALRGRVQDQNNAIIEAPGTWESSDPSAVTIDGEGLAAFGDPRLQAAMVEGARRLAEICDPVAVDAACFAGQAARIAELGGREACRDAFVFNHTPTPAEQAKMSDG